MDTDIPEPRRAAVLVAHPDDEILWPGGRILSWPRTAWFLATLCRASDEDRAPKFARVLDTLGADGAMADLDDGPEQAPLDEDVVRETLLSLMPVGRFDLLLTHGPRGEYTRHRRHEEVSRAVLDLWTAGELQADALWLFAYEDGDGARLPSPRDDADSVFDPSEAVWREKCRIITDIYGFAPESWEARVTPRVEAFHCFRSPEAALAWVAHQGTSS